MGRCSICGKQNVDTISGVCGTCIGKNRVRVRHKKTAIKIISIVLVCSVAIYILQYLASTGTLQTAMNGFSNQAIQTTEQFKKQIPIITKPISLAIKSINLSNTNLTPPSLRPKPVIDIPTLEHEIHDLINAQRMENRLTPLTFDPKLNFIARGHSQDMATRNYFEHDTPEGITFSDRYNQAGYNCQGWSGENIFQNNLYNSVEYIDGIPTSYDWNDMNELATSTVYGWMNSTGHRQNILQSQFQNEGIGVAISNDSKVYITEDFC